MSEDYNFLARGIGPALAEGSHAAYFGAHARQLGEQSEGSRAAAPYIAGAMKGEPDAIGQIAQTSPAMLQHIMPMLARAHSADQARVAKFAAWAGDTAGAILAAPEAEREGLYASAKATAEAQGVPTTNWPAGYDPNWLTVQRSHATHIRQWVPPVKAPKAGGGGEGGGGLVDMSDAGPAPGAAETAVADAGPPVASPDGTQVAGDVVPFKGPAPWQTDFDRTLDEQRRQKGLQGVPAPANGNNNTVPYVPRPPVNALAPPSGEPMVAEAGPMPIGGAAAPNAMGEGGGEDLSALSSGTPGDETSAPFAPRGPQMAQAAPVPGAQAPMVPPAAALQTPTPQGLPPRPAGTIWNVDPTLYGAKMQGIPNPKTGIVLPADVAGHFLYHLPPDGAHPKGQTVLYKPKPEMQEGDKFVDVRQNPDDPNSPIIGQRNGKTNQYHPINAKPPASADIPPEMADVHGDEFIDYLKGKSPEKANIVRSVLALKPGFLPSDLSKRGDFNNLMGLVLQAQPDFDPTGPGQRRQFEMNLAKANDPNAQTLSAANTAISHAKIYRDLVEAMNNGNTRLVTTIVNEARKQFGDANVPSAEIARDLYGEELVKAVKGGGPPNEKQEQQMRANLSVNASPKATQGVIDTLTNLMEGRVHTVEDTARKFGVPESKIKEYISPRSRETLDYIRSNPLGAPKATAAPINPVAVDRLKANPDTAAQFDEVFGQGAAAKVLGK